MADEGGRYVPLKLGTVCYIRLVAWEDDMMQEMIKMIKIIKMQERRSRCTENDKDVGEMVKMGEMIKKRVDDKYAG